MAGAHDGAQVLAQRAGLAVRAAVGVDDLDAQALDQPAQPQHGGRRVGGFEVDAHGFQRALVRRLQRLAAGRRGDGHDMSLLLEPLRLFQDAEFHAAQMGAGQGVQDMHEGRKEGGRALLKANPAGSAGDAVASRTGRSRRAASGRVDGAGRGPGAMPVAWLRPAARVAARGRILGAFGKCKDGPRSRAVMRLTGAAVHWRGVARRVQLRCARRATDQAASTARHASPARYSPTPNDAWAIRLRSRATGDWASWMRRCPRPCRAAG